MKFVCDRCQTKYSIADDRVRGKVLKVKCKTCTNVITVREARRPSTAGAPTLSAAAAARPRTGAQAALDIPMETPGVDSERTQLAQSPFAPEFDALTDLGAFAPPPPVVSKKKPTGPIPPPPVDDGVQWYMALDGNRTGPFPRQKLVDRLMPLGKGADVHIWNERLDGWKSPGEIAEIASEIARRRVPAPPPLPGAPRRPTPPPMPPIAALSHAPAPTARKPTPHAPPSPLGGHGAGPGSKLPPPSGVHPALAARAAAAEAASDPSSLLETPAPMPHMVAHAKTNGVGHSGTHAPPKPVNSDVMQMLNLPGGTQTAPGAPPRLMSISDALATGAPTPTARSRNSVYVIGLLAVIGLVVVVVVFGLKKPVKAPVVAVKPPVVETTPEPPPEKVVEPPPPAVVPVEPPAPSGKGKVRGKQGRQAKVQAPTPTPPPPGGDDADRFRDNHKLNINPTGPALRPPPPQADVMKVVTNNRAGIKICYQRALTRDNSLTHGKLSVKLSIGISGRVKHVAVDGPTQFRLLLEPCIKEVAQRWVFPQASEEYGTEFPLVFQGNE